MGYLPCICSEMVGSNASCIPFNYDSDLIVVYGCWTSSAAHFKCIVSLDKYFNYIIICTATGDSDSEDEENKVTFAYKSKRLAQREGLDDMGATLTLETETKAKVSYNLQLFSAEVKYEN